MATPMGRTTWPGTSSLLAAFFVAASLFPLRCECRCGGCDLAYASYYIAQDQNLTYISSLFGIGSQEIESRVLPPNNLTSKDSIQAGNRVKIPFSCGCLDDGTLGQTFSYLVQTGDNYATIATEAYKNLTTESALRRANNYEETRVPNNVNINVTVTCFCGDAVVSRDYGLFSTYPLISGETLATVASASGFNSSLLRSYNPTVNSSVGEIIYVPTRDENGSYRPLNPRKGLSGGAIAGISVAAIVSLVLIICLSVGIYRMKKTKKEMLFPFVAGDNSLTHKEGAISASDGISVQTPAGASSTLTGITMDKSVEFSYEELASATNDFNMSNKIGEGGFGAVYYAELRGEKAAIKKMDMQATKEFLAELKVLTHVHHLNLVRLIGYCIEGSLFLIYEYIENGNLSQHLRGSSGKEPLPWSVRVQIALDAARGLEYIHEHTVPVYIHRDIKSANILIDKNFRAKVADFGLAKLTEVGGASLQTRLVGTFGYMPPEYAQYGEVSPKIDVYAFGVVLFELISAKGAIVKTNESETESRGLVGLFENVLGQPDPREDLAKLVDPRLGDSYPVDSVYKMAQLAKACTQENPQLRPSMRSIVVALMTLSSSTEDWDVHAFYGNQALVNLMSGR